MKLKQLPIMCSIVLNTTGKINEKNCIETIDAIANVQPNYRENAEN